MLTRMFENTFPIPGPSKDRTTTATITKVSAYSTTPWPASFLGRIDTHRACLSADYPCDPAAAALNRELGLVLHRLGFMRRICRRTA